MIKVIFLDIKDGSKRTISYNREKLKNDSFERMRFAMNVNHQVSHVIGKLNKEKKEEDKCRKKSKQ